MKNIKNYIEFNESKFDIRANLKPKSKEELEIAQAKMEAEDIFKQSIKDGDINDVKQALERGADPSADNNRAIRIASAYGHKEVVKLLLNDKRTDPSDWINHAIRIASYNGHKEIVELLLKDPRVDPSDWNNRAIQWASEKCHIEIVELLLNDERVLSKLTTDGIKKYQKMICKQ